MDTAAMVTQRDRWFRDGRCIDCGWLLEDFELAQGFEKCGGCDDGEP